MLYVDADLRASVLRFFAPLSCVTHVWLWVDHPNQIFVVVLSKTKLDCRSLERELNMRYHDIVICILCYVEPESPDVPETAQQVL